MYVQIFERIRLAENSLCCVRTLPGEVPTICVLLIDLTIDSIFSGEYTIYDLTRSRLTVPDYIMCIKQIKSHFRITPNFETAIWTSIRSKLHFEWFIIVAGGMFTHGLQQFQLKLTWAPVLYINEFFALAQVHKIRCADRDCKSSVKFRKIPGYVLVSQECSCKGAGD